MELIEPEHATRAAPRHIAIIMDGNGRWARARGLPRAAGHRQGAEAVKRTVRAAIELDVHYLTLYSFSAENWQRPAEEVSDLMGLLRRYLQSEIAELHNNGIQLRVIGERERLPDDIARLIADAEQQTRGNERLVVTMAISYGGRQEIVAAARRLARAVRDEGLALEAIDEQSLGAALFTAGTPDPDLLIRTSGEQRISNFLLWQTAYCEFVFTDRLWPDFSEDDLAAAIREYQRRDRRYGAAVGSG